METLQILGQRLRELRDEKKLHQKDMGTMLHITLRHYQRMEHGDVNISALTICTLSDYFGVPADYLLGRTNVR